jgi:hypothetical protein
MYLVEIAFGHCTRAGEPLSTHKAAATEQWALQEFTQAFRGGRSGYDTRLRHHTGGYLTNAGHFMCEPCTVIFAYAPEVDGSLPLLRALAARIAAALDQESVLLIIVRVDGELHWIG